MANSKKPDTKPIIDVAHPGKSAPAGTSKPVIVTNRPILKDPMVVEDAAAPEDDAGTPVAVKTTAPTLKPTEGKTKPEPEPESETKPEPEPKSESEPQPEPLIPEATTEEDAKPKRDTEAEVAAQADAEAVEQAKADETVQKLVTTKQYFLPINSVENRKTKRFIALGVLLAVLLAVAWADIALDAGLIHIGNIKPITHFFSN